MAYATIAGLPVQYGLYTGLVPAVAYAVLGTSRALSVSTTSTVSILAAAALASTAGDDAEVAATLAVLTGAVLLGAGALRLGSSRTSSRAPCGPEASSSSRTPAARPTACCVCSTTATRLAERGAELWLARVPGRTREVLERAGTWERLSTEGRAFDSVGEAANRFAREPAGPARRRGGPGA